MFIQIMTLHEPLRPSKGYEHIVGIQRRIPPPYRELGIPNTPLSIRIVFVQRRIGNRAREHVMMLAVVGFGRWFGHGDGSCGTQLFLTLIVYLFWQEDPRTLHYSSLVLNRDMLIPFCS